MEQKQLKMWLPSFLTWWAERVLQKQAEMGYLLIAVENFGSFYTFSFESAPPLPRRFYVFRQDDIGKCLSFPYPLSRPPFFLLFPV